MEISTKLYQQSIGKTWLILLNPRYLEVWENLHLGWWWLQLDPYYNYGKPGTKYEGFCRTTSLPTRLREIDKLLNSSKISSKPLLNVAFAVDIVTVSLIHNLKTVFWATCASFLVCSLIFIRYNRYVKSPVQDEEQGFLSFNYSSVPRQSLATNAARTPPTIGARDATILVEVGCATYHTLVPSYDWFTDSPVMFNPTRIIAIMTNWY